MPTIRHCFAINSALIIFIVENTYLPEVAINGTTICNFPLKFKHSVAARFAMDTIYAQRRSSISSLSEQLGKIMGICLCKLRKITHMPLHRLSYGDLLQQACLLLLTSPIPIYVSIVLLTHEEQLSRYVDNLQLLVAATSQHHSDVRLVSPSFYSCHVRHWMVHQYTCC